MHAQLMVEKEGRKEAILMSVFEICSTKSSGRKKNISNANVFRRKRSPQK